MEDSAWLTDLFKAIDAKDADGFAAFLCVDAGFRFGNADMVTGREPIRDAVAAFFAGIKGLSHHLHNTWTQPNLVVCNGEVTYTRHDGSEVTLPFADVFEMNEGKVQKYLIYMDINPLFAVV